MSLRSSLAMGSVTPLTLAVMGALPLSPPREVWVTASSSCWTFSRMNTCQSGEKQVRRSPLTWQVIAVCHTGVIDVLVFVGVDTSEPETLLRVWILSETHFYSDPKRFAFLQMRLRLKRGSKFRSTVRTSRPSLTSSDSEWHPGSRHLFPVRNRGYKLLLINFYNYYVIILGKGRIQRSEQLIIHYNKAKQGSIWGTDMK